MPNNDSHQHVVKTSAQWNDRAIEYWVVPRGCLCVELTSRGKTKLKVGEGNKYYAQLPYICDIEDLSDYYTKEEINNLFNNLNRMAIMSTEEYDEKSDLPLTGNKLGDVRFVKSSSPSLKLDPDIYLWNGHRWIFVGYDIIDIDLSQYIKREEFEPVAAKVDEMYPKMHTHENKETLDRIEEPYTTAEKDKLDSLENYDDTEIRALIRQATHVHPNKSILDQIQQPFKNEDKTKLDSLENYDDTELRDRISDVEAVAHTHSNKDELDSIYSGFVDEHQVLVEFKTVAEEEIDDLNNDVADLKTKIHTHSNKNILDSTTAPYTTQDKATLDELAAITIFDGASPTYDGFRGYVPAPVAGQQSYFLRGDGTWAKVKQGGDKYRAGDGITILSGDVTSDTFPFKVYSKSGHLSKYIIYGNTGGVGESMGGGVYGVNISITDEHGNTSNTSIILPEKISFGDYIDYEKQVFVHMRTNVSSLVNTVDPNYRYRWAIRPNGNIASTDLGAYGSSPQVTTLVELEPGTTYELYHECSYPAFSNYMNLNVYDVDQNRTRTMNFYDSTGKVPTIIALGPNEKYIRLTWEHCDWYPNTLIKVKAVETPITLPQIPLFPNSINTINVTNTIKPAEIYVEVAEPSEDDPEDPMSEYTGIIYNDGVLDVTQDDPDNLNILTFHYRDNVTKDITIDAGVKQCVVNITQEDPDNLNELTISYADGTSAVINIPGGSGDKYVAGAGIGITDGGPISADYYFDTQVSCNLSGNRLTKTFTKYNTEPAFGAIVSVYTNESFTGPVFVGRTPDSVKYTSNTGNPQGTVVYRDETWYYSTFDGWVDGVRVDTLNNMQKIEGLFNVPAQTEDIVFAILDAGHGSPTVAEKEISVVPATTETIGGVIVGGGLEIDEDGVLSAPGGRTYVAGDGVVISDNTSFELSEDTVKNTVYFFDTQVTSSISGRTYTKYNTEPALGAVVYASSYTQPYFVGLTADSVKYGTSYDSQIWPNPDHPSFEYKGVTWYYSGNMYGMSGNGTDASGHMQKLSGTYSVSTEADLQNIARAIIDAADIITDPTKRISAKLGSGLQFDANGAIEVIGGGSGQSYVEGDAIEFSHPGMTDLGFDFDTFVSKFTQPNNGTVSVDSVNKAFTLTATGSDCYTNPWVSGSLYTIPVIGGRKYRLTWNSNASNVDGTIYAFENANTSHMHAVNQADQNYLEFTADTNSNVNFRFGVTNSGNSIRYSNIKFYEVDNGDPDTNIINVKYGNGLSLDNNNTLQVDGMVGATSQTAGRGGTVPAPSAGDENKFLRGDGTWQTVSGGTQYQAGQGIEIEPVPELIDQHFDYTVYINTVQGVEHGSIVKNNNDSFTITSTADDAYTYPYNPGYGALYTMAVEPNTKYRLTMDLSDWTVDSYVNVFKNRTTAYYWRADMPGDPYLEFTTESNTREIAFRFGITYGGHTQTFSNIKLYQVSESTTTDSISAKLGSGLQFDANNAIEAIPYTLPAASASTLGGVKVGDGLDIDANGVLEVDTGTGLTIDGNDAVSLTPATTTTLGGVIVDAGLQVAADGKMSVKYPYVTSVTNTQDVPGSINVAKYDGTSTDVDVLESLRLILNCNFDSSRIRNPLSEPVNAPSSGDTIGSAIMGDLTVLEVNE